MRPRMMIRSLAAVVVICAAPAAAHAQSLFGSRGLGVVVTPADGRTAALGGLGIALPGPSPALLNPADAGEVARRGVIVSLQPSTTEIEAAGGTSDVSATRFPLIQAHLPVGQRAVLSIGYGSYLDQNWGVTSRSEIVLGTETTTAVDEVVSQGGIAQGRGGVAFDVTESLTVGAGLGFLTGSSTRSSRRDFEGDGVGLLPYESEVETSYTAPLASLGMRWRIGSMVRVGAALTWTGDMSVDDGQTESDIDMPLQAVGGGSVQLLDDLLIAASARWTGWSATELDDVAVEDVIELGGGVEWSGIRTARRVFPVRLGGRWGGQPFSFGPEAPSESALSFGLGARLAGTQESPAALVDLAVERGSRGDFEENGLGESFWRATVSISLFSM